METAEQPVKKFTVTSVQDFLDLYDVFFPKIYNFIFRDVWHVETAEDITATVFEKALSFIKRHNIVIENFQAWIYKIATNELFSHLRKKGRKKTLSINDESLNLENLLPDERQDPSKYADFMDLKRAIGILKPKDALLVELHYFEKRDYAELEEILGERQVTLRSRIHRILQKLEVLLTEDKA